MAIGMMVKVFLIVMTKAKSGEIEQSIETRRFRLLKIALGSVLEADAMWTDLGWFVQ